jgi:hypothetical protein
VVASRADKVPGNRDNPQVNRLYSQQDSRVLHRQDSRLDNKADKDQASRVSRVDNQAVSLAGPAILQP